MRLTIDEYLESPENRSFEVTYEQIKEVILLMYKYVRDADRIAEAITKWLHLEDESPEFDYTLLVVKNIIEGKPVQNRYTGEIFN